MNNLNQPSINFQLNERGSLIGIFMEGTRMLLRENITITKKNRKQKLKLVYCKISNNSRIKSNCLFSKNIFMKKIKEMNILESSKILSLWSIDKKNALVRLIKCEDTPQNSPLPNFHYKIIMLGDDTSSSKIKVELESEVDRAQWTTKGFGSFNRMPESFKLRENDIKDWVIQLFFRDKLLTRLEHNRTRFKGFSYKIENQAIRLIYTTELRYFHFTKTPSNTYDIRLKFNRERYKKEFSGHHFVIDENDWIAAFAIITTFTSVREREIPGFLKARRNGISYSKISFNYFRIPKEPKYHRTATIHYLTPKRSVIPIGYEKDSLIYTDKENSENLEQCITLLENINIPEEQTRYDSIFILANNLDIILSSAPLVRYSLGYPIINSEGLISKIVNASKKTKSKHIYFIGINPADNIVCELKNLNFTICTPIYSDNKETLILKIQEEYLKQLSVDSLITSYSYLGVKTKVYADKRELSNHSIKNDELPERLEIIDSLPKSSHNIIQNCINEKGKIDEAFIERSLELKELIPLAFSFRIIDIYKKLENLIYYYDVKNKNYILYNQQLKHKHHVIIFDPNVSIGSNIARSIFAVYNGLFQVPFDSNELEKIKPNLNTKNMIKEINEKDYIRFKDHLDQYGESLSVILSPDCKDFLDKLVTKNEYHSYMTEEKSIEGFISLFVKNDGIFYEAISINKSNMNFRFSIGRFPTDKPRICQTIVMNTFRKYEGPKPKWNPISLISLTHKDYPENILKMLKKIEKLFNKNKKNFTVIKNPGNYPKEFTLTNLQNKNIAIFWGHGDEFTLEIMGDDKVNNKEIELVDIRKSGFGFSEIAILNSCSTGGKHLFKDFPYNVASEFLYAGYSGVCAPFWDVYPEYAVFLTKKYLTYLILGFPLSAIISLEKALSKAEGIFIYEYIYYGDPTYNTDRFYPYEVESIEKDLDRIFSKYLKEFLI